MYCNVFFICHLLFICLIDQSAALKFDFNYSFDYDLVLEVNVPFIMKNDFVRKTVNHT